MSFWIKNELHNIFYQYDYVVQNGLTTAATAGVNGCTAIIA